MDNGRRKASGGTSPIRRGLHRNTRQLKIPWDCLARLLMAQARTNRRKIIVNIATSADGYIARSNDDIEWLTSERFPDGVVQLHYDVEKTAT